jgi:hypothetical protein
MSVVTDLSYLPQIVNTGIVKGADRVLGFTFVVDTVPYELEGTDPMITITTRTGTLVAEFTIDNGGLAILSNTLIWLVTASQSDGFTAGSYTYRVILRIGDESRPYIYGSYKVVVR